MTRRCPAVWWRGRHRKREEVTIASPTFMRAEGRNRMPTYVVPLLTYLPLLLPTSLWHLLSHSKNSSPDFRVAPEIGGHAMSLSQESKKFSNPKSARKVHCLYFKLEFRIHGATKPILYMAMDLYCAVYQMAHFEHSPKRCKVDDIIPMQDKDTMAQRLNDLPKATWQVSD